MNARTRRVGDRRSRKVQSRLRTSSVWRPASSSPTVFVWPGRMRAGAISFSGSSTKRRRCARGCGSVSWGVERSSEPNAMRSRSSGRGSFKTTLGRRPNSLSIDCSLSSRDSGVSPGSGVRRTTALTNSGEPGGQSTGELCHNDEAMNALRARPRSAAMASRMTVAESPRLEPRATTASWPKSDEGGCAGELTSAPARPACRRCRASASRPTAPRAGRHLRRSRGCWPCGSVPHARHQRQR